MTPEPHAFLPLTPREFHVLLALADESRNGYQIGQQVERNSGERVRLSPATQFTVLHRLVQRGLVQELADGGARSDGRGQRFWTLSTLGRRVLRAEAERLAADAALALALGSDE